MRYNRTNTARAYLTLAALTIAALLHLASSAGARSLVRSIAQTPEVAAALLELEPGSALRYAPPEDEPEEADEPPEMESEPEAEAAAEDEPADAPQETSEQSGAPVFTQADAAAIALSGTSGYSPDVAALLLEHPLRLDGGRAGPQVLIVHTHASEAYTPSPGWEYEASDTMRTEDTEKSVVRVGAEIARELEALGVGVIHDTTIRDYPTYNGAYTRTLAAIEEALEENPSICCVIDVHRDAAEDEAGELMGFSCTVDGADAAQLMLVVGTDAGGLPHPDWEENLALALRVQALLLRVDASLCRPIDLRSERFNQHATFGSLLVEVGASGNTMPEALESARYFARALAAALSST